MCLCFAEELIKNTDIYLKLNNYHRTEISFFLKCGINDYNVDDFITEMAELHKLNKNSIDLIKNKKLNYLEFVPEKFKLVRCVLNYMFVRL